MQNVRIEYMAQGAFHIAHAYAVYAQRKASLNAGGALRRRRQSDALRTVGDLSTFDTYEPEMQL